MEDEKIDKGEVWSAIRYLDPDEREKDKEINTATINRSIGSSAYGWRCLGSTLASSKTTVISFTTDGGKISSDQCDRMPGDVGQFQSFLMINTVLSSIWSSSAVLSR